MSINNTENKTFAQLVKEYKKIQVAIKAKEQELDELKQVIIEQLNGREEVKESGYTIRFATRVRNDLDRTAIKTELPEIAAKYTKITTYSEFSIK